MQRTTRFVRDALIILACEALNAVAFNALIVPARLLSGGVIGSSMLLNQLFNLPIGLQTMIYNIPIFILGYRYLGKRFIALSLLGVVTISIFTDNIRLSRATSDLLLAAVFGGVMTGIADGIILRVGGSTGGFDIIGLIVARRFGISVGQVFLFLNGILITLSALVNNLELAMYTLITLYVSSRVVNALQETAPRRVALVISPRNPEIAARIMHDLNRGVTYLQGSGAYTERDFRVLMCVVTRYEMVELRQLIREIDPEAFSVVLDASDVVGRFDAHSPLQKLIGPKRG
jgi:uncharacterized membrane-anchored protein YitT (DUF2179 family)